MPSANVTEALDNFSVALSGSVDALVNAAILIALIIASVGLTFAMFHSRNALLGFPCAIMWALLGGYAYTLSTIAWDFYFILAFACMLGMTTFSALGAYGLREKRDTLGDESMEKSEGKFMDEKQEENNSSSERVMRVRDRAERRRTNLRRKGEFNW